MNNKMDPKSLICVFPGYNEKYKSFRCFHPPTGRVYISRHVLFNESQFPYSDICYKLLPTPASPLLSAWRPYVVTSVDTPADTEENQSFNYREEEFPPLQRVNATVPPQQALVPLSPIQDDHHDQDDQHVSLSSNSSDLDNTDE